MGGAASRRKGHDWEREVANLLKEVFGEETRRGLSQSRGGGKEEPDVVLPQNVCVGINSRLRIECKKGKKTDIKAALRQCFNDCPESSQVAICKDDNQDATATMFLADWIVLVKEWWQLKTIAMENVLIAVPDDGAGRLQ